MSEVLTCQCIQTYNSIFYFTSKAKQYTDLPSSVSVLAI